MTPKLPLPLRRPQLLPSFATWSEDLGVRYEMTTIANTVRLACRFRSNCLQEHQRGGQQQERKQDITEKRKVRPVYSVTTCE